MFAAARFSKACYAPPVAFIRVFFISLTAAFMGSAAGSILLFGELGRASFFTLPFTTLGSTLLLAPLYAAAREDGMPVGACYARITIAGGGAGGLMLGFICLLTNPLEGAAIGVAYGVLTAVSWITIHAMAKRLSAVVR